MGDVFHTYDFCENDSISSSFDFIGSIISVFIGIIVFGVICLISGGIAKSISDAIPNKKEYGKYKTKMSRCRLHKRRIRSRWLKHG